MSSNKVVLVTGCSDGGIGSSLCTAFALRGCTVYASARKLDSMSTLAESIHRLELDVTSAASVEAAVAAVLAAEGHIDILVNNAGAGATGALLDFDVDQAQGVFEVNYFGVLRVIQAVAPAMVRTRDRKPLIINVGSIMGNVGTPWVGNYAASKAALKSMSDVLRMELAPLGVRVMLIAGGAIKSNFGKKQTASIVMPVGSLYECVVAFIRARATLGQDDPNTLQTPAFAKLVVDKALQSSGPPNYFTAGGKSWTFWLLERLPSSIVRFLLMRNLGVNKLIPPPQSKKAIE